MHLGKRLVEKAKIDFIIYGFIDWETNNYDTGIAQYVQEVKAIKQ